MQKRCFLFVCDLGNSDYLMGDPKHTQASRTTKGYILRWERGDQRDTWLTGQFAVFKCAPTSQAKQGFESLMGRWAERKRRHSKEGPLMDVTCVPGSWSQCPSMGVTVHSCHMVTTNIPIVLFVRRASPGLGTWLSR